MILNRRVFTNHGLPVAIAALFALTCSKDNPVGNKNALCPGQSGVGLRVEGRAQPLDVCVDDSAVDALLTSSSHYDVSAQLALEGGDVVQLHMLFSQRGDVPVSLRPVSSIAEATNDAGAVYVYYEELPSGGTPIQSSVITGGKFRLTFADNQVTAGTLENIHMDMTNVQNGEPAGERQITEGFFSVSVTPPAAGPPAPPARVSMR